MFQKHVKETKTFCREREQISLQKTKMDYSDSKSEDDGDEKKETEQGRRQRRLNKKQTKQATIKKNEREYFGHSTGNNPFGDSWIPYIPIMISSIFEIMRYFLK